jgi:hypothetical protein
VVSRYLTACFAACTSRRMNVRVGRAGADRRDQLFHVARLESIRRAAGGDVGRHDGAANRGGLSGTQLRAGGPVSEVRAEEHDNGAGDVLVREVDVRLRHGALHVFVREFPLDLGFFLVDARDERRAPRGRERRRDLVVGAQTGAQVSAASVAIIGERETDDRKRARASSLLSVLSRHTFLD